MKRVQQGSRFLGAEAPRNDNNKGITTARLKATPLQILSRATFSAACEAAPLQELLDFGANIVIMAAPRFPTLAVSYIAV
jgi:hypothetical protein